MYRYTKMEKITHPEMKYENYSGPVFFSYFLSFHICIILYFNPCEPRRMCSPAAYKKKKK